VVAGEIRLTKNFRNLTNAQQKVLGDISIGQIPFCSPKTIQILLAKGLIEQRPDKPIYGKGNSPIDRIPLMVAQYEMPIQIHIEWCQWCAEQPDNE
jgi:hypothetical protein